MPTLHILGGANGSGKTTYYFAAIAEGFIDPQLPFINVDQIILKELGATYSEMNSLKAEAMARERMTTLLAEHSSFMIESNLAKESEYDWVDKMKMKGYEAILYFLGTENVQTNIERVRRRVLQGGHDVPVNIIRHRYDVGLMYLKRKLFLFTEAHMIDSSYKKTRRIVHLKDGIILSKKEPCPQWIESALSFVTLIQSKKKKP